MSIKVMAWAWEQELPAVTKFILIALADHADDEGVCWPGQKGIAKKCGVSRQTVNAHIKKLLDMGLLTWTVRHRDDGSITSNLYQLTLRPALQDSQPALQGVSTSFTGGVNAVDRGSQPALQQEPSFNHQENHHIEPSLYREIEYLQTLRAIPGWPSKGEPHLLTLMAWIQKKGWSDDLLERAAIGLSKVNSKSLAGYSNLTSAFQDRLNHGYDDPRRDIERSNNGNRTYRQHSTTTIPRKESGNGGGSSQDIPREASPFAKYRGT